MSTMHYDNMPTQGTPVPLQPTKTSARPPLNRIGEVRQQQNISLRTIARQSGVEVRDLKDQEKETADLRLSDLYRWQEALDVPVADLLIEPGTSLSTPVMERARMVRLMKTAAAILETAQAIEIRRMAQMLVEQLIDAMPELAHVGAWQTVGKRRGLDEYGRIVERCLSEDVLCNYPGD